MNCYKIDDIYVGQKEQFEYHVTEDKMKAFLDLTADVNPLHVDEEYAKAQGYPGRVVYGMLTASLISKLGGVLLPGKYCLIQSVEVKFVKPVFIGDVLIVTGEVAKVETALNYMEVKVTISNQIQQKVLRGLMKAGVLDEKQ